MSGVPLGYLSASGDRAAAVVPLTWYMIVVSCAVSLIILALLVAGVVRRRIRDHSTQVNTVEVTRSGQGMRWIVIGLLVSAVPLAVSLIWTMTALAAVVGPPNKSALVVDITAHQWWWQIDYNGKSPSQHFTTANELHVPVGRKVLVRLHSGDVIHSFWVPRLTGKTDVIPGQTNLSWLKADRPGTYFGHCAEYCGMEHARMGFRVIAQPEAQFRAWRARQLQPAAHPASALATRGHALFHYRCSLCHTVRGTNAASRMGPDLTHLMSRRTLAAGMLPNNRGALAGWVDNPQASKPGAHMPNQHLTGPQLQQVVAYLETLQ
ncbi:MAG: cytochrome c oxidase subunit II [Sphingomonadaceae bacterium]